MAADFFREIHAREFPRATARVEDAIPGANDLLEALLKIFFGRIVRRRPGREVKGLWCVGNNLRPHARQCGLPSTRESAASCRNEECPLPAAWAMARMAIWLLNWPVVKSASAPARMAS